MTPAQILAFHSMMIKECVHGLALLLITNQHERTYPQVAKTTIVAKALRSSLHLQKRDR